MRQKKYFPGAVPLPADFPLYLNGQIWSSGSEQGFLPQGPGWATTSHSPGHSVTSTDEKVVDTHGHPPSTPPLLPSLAEPWICAAATGSDLVGFPSPEIKPNLAPQPPSPVTVLGVRV